MTIDKLIELLQQVKSTYGGEIPVEVRSLRGLLEEAQAVDMSHNFKREKSVRVQIEVS